MRDPRLPKPCLVYCTKCLSFSWFSFFFPLKISHDVQNERKINTFFKNRRHLPLYFPLSVLKGAYWQFRELESGTNSFHYSMPTIASWQRGNHAIGSMLVCSGKHRLSPSTLFEMMERLPIPSFNTSFLRDGRGGGASIQRAIRYDSSYIPISYVRSLVR